MHFLVITYLLRARILDWLGRSVATKGNYDDKITLFVEL